MRDLKFRRDSVALWTFLLIIGSLAFLVKYAWAGDYHQDTQGHVVTYTITDSNGDPVSGQTPRVAVKNTNSGLWLDFSDSTFKAPTSATTLFQTMTFDQTGGYYYRIVSIDNAVMVSADIVFVVSNDDATYGDVQSDTVTFDNLNNLIKINR